MYTSISPLLLLPQYKNNFLFASFYILYSISSMCFFRLQINYAVCFRFLVQGNFFWRTAIEPKNKQARKERNDIGEAYEMRATFCEFLQLYYSVFYFILFFYLLSSSHVCTIFPFFLPRAQQQHKTSFAPLFHYHPTNLKSQ